MDEQSAPTHHAQHDARRHDRDEVADEQPGHAATNLNPHLDYGSCTKVSVNYRRKC